MDWLAWREDPTSQRGHKLDRFVVNHSALDVVKPINTAVCSHGDLAFVNLFAFNTVCQRHFRSLFDRVIKWLRLSKCILDPIGDSIVRTLETEPVC